MQTAPNCLENGVKNTTNMPLFPFEGFFLLTLKFRLKKSNQAGVGLLFWGYQPFPPPPTTATPGGPASIIFPTRTFFQPAHDILRFLATTPLGSDLNLGHAISGGKTESPRECSPQQLSNLPSRMAPRVAQAPCCLPHRPAPSFQVDTVSAIFVCSDTTQLSRRHVMRRVYPSVPQGYPSPGSQQLFSDLRSLPPPSSMSFFYICFWV